MTVDALHNEIRSQYQQLSRSVSALRFWHARYVDDLAARHRQEMDKLARTFSVQRQEAETVRRGEVTAADDALANASQHIHTGWEDDRAGFPYLASAWDDPVWQQYAPNGDVPVAPAVRVGRLVLPGDPGGWDLPAFVPFLGQGHLFVTGQDTASGHNLLQSILLRLLLTCPPGALQLHLLEPGGAGNLLSGFLHLPPELSGGRVHVRGDDISAQLSQTSDHIAAVVQNRLRNLYPTVEAYNAENPATAVAYRVLVVTDLPGGLDERQWAALLHIARNGPRAGVYLLGNFDPAAKAVRDVQPEALLSLGTNLALTGPDRLLWRDAEMGEFPVQPDPLPGAAEVNRLLAALSDALASVESSLAFGDIVIPPAQRWKGDSRQGLQIPLGVDSTGGLQRFNLGQGLVHHGLIGGTTGSGKSNLLHVLITQLALLYPPEELALYLLDFREGVEFQDYLRLPHARVIALESEREFGLSILQRLHAEIEERGRLFRAAGAAQVIQDYRDLTGQLLPRILLIIDEFQVLFAQDDALAREAGRILEDLTRRGRGFGIHLLLSSQSPAMPGLYSRNIYEQMGLRIAFRCSGAVSQAILGEGNTAAAHLSQPGQAIYNDSMGDSAYNREARIALVSPAERRSLLTAVNALAGARPYPLPITFAARSPARLEDNPELQTALSGEARPATDEPVKLWLGEPIAITPPTAALLERYEGSNLLILGGDESQAYGLLLASLLSLAAQRSPADARFLIADFSRPASRFAGLFVRLELPHRVDVFNARQLRVESSGPPLSAAPYERPRGGPRSILDDPQLLPPSPPLSVSPLQALESLVNERWASLESGSQPAENQDVYIFIAGLHGWRDLRPSDFKPTPTAELLLRLAERGPDVGVHIIAWADSYGTMDQTLKRSGLALFDLRVYLRLGEGDSNQLLGSPLAARLADNRAYYRHQSWTLDGVEKFKPYAVPEVEVLETLLGWVRDRMQSVSTNTTADGEGNGWDGQ